jgi:hypothetical protein
VTDRRADASRGGDPPNVRRLLILLAAALLVVAVDVVIGRVPGTGSLTLDTAVGFVVSLSVMGVLMWRLISLRLSPWTTAAIAVAALAAAIGLSWLGWIWPAVPFKVVAAVLLGTLLGRVMEAPSWLLAAAIVAFLADLWSVFAGPTKVVVERAPVVLDYALVHFPMLGSTLPGAGLGMTDLLFVAVFVTGSRRVGLRPRASFLAMLASFVLTLCLTVALDRALPALPLLALAFLATNVDLFRRGKRLPAA